MDGKILVTGGAGYIGSHVVVALADAGYTPMVLDNFATSSRAVMPRLSALTGAAIELVEADVRDRTALRRVFHDQPIVGIVHCAALKGVGDGEERPLAYWDVNVGGTVALAEVAGEAGVARLVYSSSATVYGQPDRLPVTEDAPLRPQSVYGRTKRAAEDFLRDLTRANANWRIALLRYFNPAGAHPSARIGERIVERSENLVPHLCRIAAGEVAELSIFGSDWPTEDGTPIRDYLHVVDLAEAHVAATRFLASAPGATTFNLGSGRGHSVLQVVAAFERACGRRIARTFAPRRAGDVACYYADSSRAAALLAWEARRDLDVVCADAWRWQQSGGY
jgi:UDP-glucose 4-epimerase